MRHATSIIAVLGLSHTETGNKNMDRTLAPLALTLASSAALAGGGPLTTEAIPIGNDVAMLGLSLVLAGIAARIISRRARK